MSKHHIKNTYISWEGEDWEGEDCLQRLMVPNFENISFLNSCRNFDWDQNILGVFIPMLEATYVAFLFIIKEQLMGETIQ